nr:DNA-directed DNA polymerase [Tanacetum cinerariifolium]
MRTRSNFHPSNSTANIPKRSNRRRIPNIVEPEIRTIAEIVPMADRTMEELLQAPMEGYAEAIVIPKILAENFEIKTNLLQNVPNDAIKLMLFPYSLEGAARVWIDKLADQISNLVKIVNKQVIAPAKAVEKTCVTCRGAHAYYECIATDSNPSSVCVATGFYNQVSPPNRASHQIPPPGFALVQNSPNRFNQNQVQGNYFNQANNFNQGNNFRGNNFQNNQGYRAQMNNASNFQNQEQASTLGTLYSNTIPNPKGEIKAVTTRSGLAYEGPSIPTESPLGKVDEQNTEEILDKEHSNSLESIAQVQPPVVPISIPKPDVPRTQTKTTIPYPSRLNDQKLREKATNQMEKFFQIFHDFHFDISFADALLLMPKFASTIKKKLGDLGKFLIPCDFPGMEVCHALADLGASINLMPLSIWKKLLLPELTPTRINFELADRSITHPKGVAEDVFIKVGKFHFLTDFVMVDIEADLRVPLILGRFFLRTGRALIDVYGEEITLMVNDESITYNLNQTMRYSLTYDDTSINRVDVIDIACEDFVQDVLDLQYNPKSSSPTLVSESDYSKEPIVKSSSPTLTPFGESDFFLEEIKDFLNDDSIPIEIKNSVYDSEGDILFLEKLLNEDPFQLPPMDLKLAEESKEKSSVEEPPELELKELSVCIDYRKLNDATRKDHFPLPFMDQMLERLVGNEFYCFLDGFLGYFQIPIDPQDQEKTTFTCPYGTFAYRRMPFGLCNAPGHKISKSGIEVDRAKVDVIAKLPHLTTVKGVRSFLGHAGLYHRFIQDFLKIARPMTHLLEKETPFVFSKECIDAFNTLKKKLTEASILVVPDWNLPFELMCDASDYAISAVLRQCKSKHFQPIHYASKTMTEAQIHYTTTEKEMLAIIRLFDVVFMGKKLLKFSKLAMRDLLEAIMVPTSQRRRGRVKYLREMRCLKTVSKFVRYSIFGVETKALPTNDAKVVVKFLKSLFFRFERTVGENRTSWSDKLDDALWAFRTAYKTPIGCTPYKLVYGKSCHLLSELEHRAYWALKHVNFDLKTAGDHRKLQLNDLSELRDQAYENSVIYKERTKKLHGSKIKNCIFNVGDQVLLFNSRLKIFSGKLKTRWSGPFTITCVFPYGTIELSQPNDLHTFPMDN